MDFYLLHLENKLNQVLISQTLQCAAIHYLLCLKFVELLLLVEMLTHGYSDYVYNCILADAFIQGHLQGKCKGVLPKDPY